MERPESLHASDARDVPPANPPEVSSEQGERPEGDERAYLLSAVEQWGLHPASVLEVLANYEPPRPGTALATTVEAKAATYGVRLAGLPEAWQRKLTILVHAHDRSCADETKADLTRATERMAHRALAQIAIHRIDGLRAELAAANDPDAVRAKLRSFLEAIRAVAVRVPPEEWPNTQYWREVIAQFQEVGKQRAATLDAALRQVYDEVLEEYHDALEDELVMPEIWRRGNAGVALALDDVISDLYGYTPERLEAVKRRNRAQVTTRLTAMHEDEPYVTTDMLEALHAVNNRGIVPRATSHLREHPHERVQFMVRKGTFPREVRDRVEAVLERANALIDAQAATAMPDAQYAVAVAKLQNELLDIHPFLDRNGSTSLLFAELMMMRRGYEPSPERPSGYYAHLRQVFRGNPVALGVVAYEHFRIAHVPGTYDDDASLLDDARRAYQHRKRRFQEGNRRPEGPSA